LFTNAGPTRPALLFLPDGGGASSRSGTHQTATLSHPGAVLSFRCADRFAGKWRASNKPAQYLLIFAPISPANHLKNKRFQASG
jgi:hypothetical protein